MSRREIDEMVIWQRRVLRPVLLRQRVIVVAATAAIVTVMVLILKLT
jgi:hypothetical protein